MEINTCKVCLFDSDQFKVMLTCLMRRLRTLSPDYLPDYREEDLARSEGFLRLMNCVFGEGNTNSPHCSHQRIHRYLRRKLKCDHQTFGQLCSRLLEKLAERNYHLEVLQQQMRSVSNSVMGVDRKKFQEREKVDLGPSLRTIGSESAIGQAGWHQQPRNQSFPMVFLGNQLPFSLLYPPGQGGKGLACPQKPSAQ